MFKEINMSVVTLKSIVKKVIPRFVLDRRLYIIKQINNFKILAKVYNQYQTICKWSCIDRNNNPIPWYSYPAIEYISNLDFSNKTILEWGSGNSSLFWAKRSKNVTSIEDDEEWFNLVDKSKLANQSIHLKMGCGGR